MMHITVPELDDPDFIKIENRIDAEFEATYVEHKPIEADVLDCFNIVSNHTNQHGGKSILGWQIWKSTILIEAEAHAVWEVPGTDELLDISPKQGISVERILFIEDSRLNYEGKQINNVRLNITKNQLVDHFIELANLFFHFQNKGIRAQYHDLSKILTLTEIQEIQDIHDWKSKLEFYIYSGNTQESACFCGTEKKYKNCHGKNFGQTIKRLKYKT